jgi:hypothetical protein
MSQKEFAEKSSVLIAGGNSPAPQLPRRSGLVAGDPRQQLRKCLWKNKVLGCGQHKVTRLQR